MDPVVDETAGGAAPAADDNAPVVPQDDTTTNPPQGEEGAAGGSGGDSGATGAQPDNVSAVASADAPTVPMSEQAPLPAAAQVPPEQPAAAASAQPAVTPQEDLPPLQASTLRVKFTARPVGFSIVEMFPPAAPGLVLYNRLEKVLQAQRRNMRLYWEGRPISDIDVISDLCVMPDDDQPLLLDLEFEVLPHHLRVLAPGERATRTIGIDVQYGDGIPAKSFFVTLVKGFERKPFLGGYQDKRNHNQYHHAATQTYVERENRRDAMNSKVTRMTQTQGVTRSCQTMRETYTQMSRTDLVVDTSFDRIVIAKPYFSAKMLEEVQEQKAIKLQAFVRGWRARKTAQTMREERFKELYELEREDQRRREIHASRRKEELERRMHPKTAHDFQVLHNELEAWRLQEVQRIDEANLTVEERRIAMQELLKKETKLLQTIDRLQIQANSENRATRVTKRLETMASAKEWGTNTVVKVETPFTVRARELRDLYDGLLVSGLSIDERLDVLLHVKWTVKEFDCALTREIVELIDREADLLNRGRKEATLQNLRQRVANLFLQFVETPEFNPEAMQVQRVPLEFKSRPLVQLSRK